MAKSSNQKLKVLYLQKLLLEETDEAHPMTMEQIIAALAARDIPANRKSIYADIADLRDYGMDIIGEKRGSQFVYYAASRLFELAEVKLLADAVASARFISEKKSGELTKKLGKLTSRDDAKKLIRAVMSAGKGKTVNENVYYTVDAIHTAINTNVQIRFRYYQWTRDKVQELRHGGSFYTVSPRALVWDDEYYYLVAVDGGKIKHFRVDKMLSVSLTELKREGGELFERMDLSTYTRKTFGMFSGEEERVSLEAENRYAGILIDRFGKDIFMYPAGPDHFKANVDVAVSEQFFSWVFSLGEGIRITGPEKVLVKVREMTERLGRQYLTGNAGKRTRPDGAPAGGGPADNQNVR